MKAALLIALALVGCASKPELRQPAAIEVDKVVVEKCVKTAPKRPIYATEALSAIATDIDYGDALAGDWILSRGYERELEIIAQACTDQGK